MYMYGCLKLHYINFLNVVRFEADNWNKQKHLCSKAIGAKMKVQYTAIAWCVYM